MVELLGGMKASASPPAELVRAGHLGPLAYRAGVTAFRDEYAASMIMTERRRALLAEVTTAFAKRGVRAALIKGIAFIGTIYPDPATRPMNDMDLLVPRAQLAEAVKTMFELGFERVGYSRKLSGYYHAIAFNRGGLMVELHRNIMQPYRTNMRVGDIWRRTRPDPALAHVERLDPIDEILICTVHVARHELAVPAINYVDVARLWARQSEPERAAVQARAKEYRISRAVAAVLAMTELLARGVSGHPDIGRGSAILPTTDDVLLGVRPTRGRQLGQKLLLTEGPRELLGLGYVYASAIISGYRRT